MSTVIAISGVGITQTTLDAAVQRGRQFAEDWEETFSRFRPESELCRLNAAQGQWTAVSETFLSVLAPAVAAALQTAGRFDPTILPALEAAGYDRDIAEVRACPSPLAGEGPRSCSDIPGGVEIDHERRMVRLHRSTRLDLGGIAKGAFVDRLAAELVAWPGGCVDAGGDLFVWGEPPSGRWWTIGIEDPLRPEMDSLVAELKRPSSAAATSATHRRRWLTGYGIAHHLIDPQTARPLAGRALAATAFAPAVATAEIATKALIVAAARGEPLLPFGCDLGVVILAGGESTVVRGNHADAYTLHSLESARCPA